MGEDKKTCGISVSLYVLTILLIIKGVTWITYTVSAYFFSDPTEVDDFGQIREYWAPPEGVHLAFIPGCLLIFGILSLVCGIFGIVGTAKKHIPIVVANAVLLFVLVMLEGAFYVMLVVWHRVQIVATGVLWAGVPSILITLATFLLNLAWHKHIKKSKV